MESGLLAAQQAGGGVGVGDNGGGAHGAAAVPEAGPWVEVGVLLADDGGHRSGGGGHGDGRSDVGCLPVEGHFGPEAGCATLTLGAVLLVTFELGITGQGSGVKGYVRGQRLSMVVGA